MIFSTAAVRSLSSLLVVAMATTTPSGVGGAMTMNRKLSKNTVGGAAPPTVTPTTKCPTVALYYPLANNNTIGSPHIIQAFPIDGWEKLCVPDGETCIGDTYTNFNTLYADAGLTQQVATLASTTKVVNIKVGTVDPSGHTTFTQVNMIAASIVYDDTNTELNYGGYSMDAEFTPGNNMNLAVSGGTQDLAVSGGTQECALNFGTITFVIEPGATYGAVEFNLVDLKNKL